MKGLNVCIDAFANLVVTVGLPMDKEERRDVVIVSSSAWSIVSVYAKKVVGVTGGSRPHNQSVAAIRSLAGCPDVQPQFFRPGGVDCPVAILVLGVVVILIIGVDAEPVAVVCQLVKSGGRTSTTATTTARSILSHLCLDG